MQWRSQDLEVGAQGVGDGSPLAGSRERSPPEADDFSQLKGYLDATSGILGGHDPLPPLKSTTARRLP